MKTVKCNDNEFTIGKIVCIGRNYVKHAEELGNEVPKFPLIFLKPASNLISSGEEIIHPEYSNEMHHEVELVLLIGEEVKNCGEEEAKQAIAGYTVGLDMTLRDLQSELKKNGHPWTIAKCFDGAAVIGEFISSSEYEFTGTEKISLSVNSETRQDSDLSKMIFTPAEIVKYISSKMRLEPGDLIYTGTPAGVGKVVRGDLIHASIQNIADLNTGII